MEGESSAFFTLECKHGGAGVLPCGDEAALAKYPGSGELAQIVVHYFYLNYFSFQESLDPRLVDCDTPIHIFLQSEQKIKYLII